MPDLRARLQQTVAGKYRIVRELTGGGMSRVFLAEDTELEREVAIKILAPNMGDELDARFRQEVQQTARLQHPTIVPLLEVGTLEDERGRSVPFYVMQYVRGETLRTRILHEGHLSLNLTVRILRNVLDALVHAHAHGIIHRDIKPENIFLSGTSAVLADFGIAKVATGPQAERSITSPGTTVGTPTYMAPEQLAGDDTMDHGADLFSVGVVAYEMLTGKLPWTGATPSQTLAAKTRNKIVSLRTARPDVPASLAAMIESALSWDPAERPRSAMEMLRVVEGVPTMPTTPASLTVDAASSPRWRLRKPQRASLITAGVLLLVAVGASVGWRAWGSSRQRVVRLAVLYPEARSATGADSTLSEQLYHLLASTLHPVAGLALIGEVSIPQMVDRGLTTAQITDSLRAAGVDSALVLRAIPATGGSYLLSVELKRLGGSRSEVVAGPISLASLKGLAPDSMRTLVKLLAGQVVTRLALTSANHDVPETQLIDAWVAWSKGRDAYARRTPAGLREAIGYFDRAIALDSLYAQAHAELSNALGLALFYHYRDSDPPYDVAARALALAERAIKLAPNFADGYLARAYIGTVTGAPLEFLRQNYAQAQRLTSTNPFSQIWYVSLLAAENRFPEALRRLEDEARKDPKSPAQRIAVALYALTATEYLTAVRAAAEARALQRDIPISVQLGLWARLLLRGRAVDDCASLDAGPYLGVRALCLEGLQRGNEARTVIDSLFKIVTDKAPVDSTFDMSLYVAEMATYYAARNEPESAKQWLRQAFAESPEGIDWRLVRAGFFSRDLIALTDTLRADAWRRVRTAATARPAIARP